MLDKFSNWFTQLFSLENPHIQKGISTYQRFEHFAPPLSFIAGFGYDSFTLSRIDRLSDNLILLLYLVLLGTSIVLFHLIEKNIIQLPALIRHKKWIPVAIQFFIGGLFSAYVIFYFQSVSFTKGAFFLSLLLVLLIANEVFHQRLTNIYLQMALFFLAVFSFLTFLIPVLVKDMGGIWFLLGGLLSLLAVSGLLYLLYSYSALKSIGQLKRLALMILFLFSTLNLFYLLNWIPPIPLSVRHAGIYHQAKKTDQGFEVSYQTQPWYAFWRQSDSQVEMMPGDSVFCFAAVFAPTALNTAIYHHWQRYLPNQEKWESTDRIRYPISGGRDGGYRGYTFKKNISEGEWRVTVETTDKRVLGRMNFHIEKVSSYSRPLRKAIR